MLLKRLRATLIFHHFKLALNCLNSHERFIFNMEEMYVLSDLTKVCFS